YERLGAANHGPLPAESVRPIFREIIAACLALEQQLRIAFLGPLGTFSHEAVRQQFGAPVALLPADSIGAVFDEVEQRRADYGVVPVENSTEGVVPATLDRFVSTALTVKAEVQLRIEMCLLAGGGAGKVQRIVSHPQSLGQCRQWLAQHFAGV